METVERWLPVVGYEGYEVSDFGRVRGKKGLIAQYINYQGYANTSLYSCCGNKKNHRAVLIHGLVLRAFRGERKQGMQCRHLDGNKLNNRLENLQWGTYAENYSDSLRLGEYRHFGLGEKNSNAKLNGQSIVEIKALKRIGYKPAKLARVYGVSSSTIYNILRGTTWKQVQP